MRLKSLALTTNLIYDRFFSQIRETNEYIAIKTPERPQFYWGNYLIFKSAPQNGDLAHWEACFEAEIEPIAQTGFVALTFDTPSGHEDVPQEFMQSGYQVMRSKILTAQRVERPAKWHKVLEIRSYQRSEDWLAYEDVHFNPNWSYGSEAEQRAFLQSEARAFQRLVLAGKAQRYGAFESGQMVADLGIYWEQGLGRFHNVGTHRDFRRKGACSTLVHTVSEKYLSSGACHTLVMEADADYHAAAIYESVGFQQQQGLISLEWQKPQVQT